MNARTYRWQASLGALTLLAGGCLVAQRAEKPPDDRYGHRHVDELAGDRETIVIVPPDTMRQYFQFAAPFDTVHVRPAPFPPGSPTNLQGVPVEVLVKGSLPDACIELHDLLQERTGHLLQARLMIRRPRGAVCATVVRPYRFYFMLPGRFVPGHYTLKLNERIIPFQVYSPPD